MFHQIYQDPTKKERNGGSQFAHRRGAQSSRGRGDERQPRTGRKSSSKEAEKGKSGPGRSDKKREERSHSYLRGKGFQSIGERRNRPKIFRVLGGEEETTSATTKERKGLDGAPAVGLPLDILTSCTKDSALGRGKE